MKTLISKQAAQLLVVGVALAASGSTFAASTWNAVSAWNLDGCGSSGGMANGALVTNTSTAGGGCLSGTPNLGTGSTANSVRAFAYSVGNVTSGETFAKANVMQWGTSYGLGVNYAAGTNKDGSSYVAENPQSAEHTMDNNLRTELIAFHFDQSTTLDKVTLGYSSGDADFSLFAWNGAGTPGTDASGIITGKTAAGLTTSGWSLVGNYANVASPNTTDNIVRSVNSAGISSSWWIVSAYSSNYGSSSNLVDQNGVTVPKDTGSDFVKVMALSSKTFSGGTTPEPGSLALVGAGLIGLVASRRRKLATV